MEAKIVTYILAFCLLAFVAGCQRVQEPWVRGPEQLKEERFRTAQAQMELRDRLIRVQTDR